MKSIKSIIPLPRILNFTFHLTFAQLLILLLSSAQNTEFKTSFLTISTMNFFHFIILLVLFPNLEFHSINKRAFYTYLVFDSGPRIHSNVLNLKESVDKNPDLLKVTLKEETLSPHFDLTGFYVDQEDAYVFGMNTLHHFNVAKWTLDKNITVEIKDGCQQTEKLCECTDVALFTTVFGNKDSIIACGPRDLGMCRKFDRKNLNKQEKLFDSSKLKPEDVIDSYNSSVIFRGSFIVSEVPTKEPPEEKAHTTTEGHTTSQPVPEKPKEIKYQEVFYIGFENDCKRPSIESVPFISARTLTTSGLAYATPGSHMSITHKDKERSKFIYGFEDGPYSYFVTVFTDALGDPETRISRVCRNNENFDTYTEVPLRCGAFFKATSGANFKHGAYGETLLLSFETEHDKIAAVCLFKMDELDEDAFMMVTHNCFKGGKDPSIIPGFGNTADAECKPEESKDKFILLDNLCKRTKNQFIRGTKPYSGKTLLYLLDEKIMSIAAKEIIGTGKNPFNLLVTTTQKILSVDVEQDQGELKLTENFIYPIKSGISVSQHLAPIYNDKTDSFYVLSSTSLIQVPLRDCSIYTSCSRCISGNRDCLWNQGKCKLSRDIPANERSLTCPPEVKSFSPTSGPLEGGTELTISGSHFGNYSEWYFVKVGNRKCKVAERNETLVRCTIEESLTAVPSSFKINFNDTTQTDKEYTFVKPEVHGIFPSFGPVSGGTNVLIYGKNLDTGSKLEVLFGQSPCGVMFRHADYAICKSGPLKTKLEAPPKNAMEIKVSIDSSKNLYNLKTLSKMDSKVTPKSCLNEFKNLHFCKNSKQFFKNATESVPREKFTYYPNPEITKAGNLYTVTSGETLARFQGQNFRASAFPVIALFMDHVRIREIPCETSETVMECLFTNISHLTGKNVNYKIFFDGHKMRPQSEIKIHPDPSFDDFTNHDNIDKLQSLTGSDEFIEFSGKNLHPGLPYQINLLTTSNKEEKAFNCLLKTDTYEQGKDNSRLFCRPGDEDRKEITEKKLADKKLKVRIRIGNSLSWEPGSIRYENNIPLLFKWFMVIAATLICLAVAGLIYWKIEVFIFYERNFRSNMELADLVD